MKKNDSRKNSNIVWELFSSVKLVLFLLIILAITSIFGTIIPQQERAKELFRERGDRKYCRPCSPVIEGEL